MQALSFHTPVAHYPYHSMHAPITTAVACGWQQLREQLLCQWRGLSRAELDEAGPDRRRIAQLIERKYGITACLVENYLRNFERTMPLSN